MGIEHNLGLARIHQCQCSCLAIGLTSHFLCRAFYHITVFISRCSLFSCHRSVDVQMFHHSQHFQDFSSTHCSAFNMDKRSLMRIGESVNICSSITTEELHLLMNTVKSSSRTSSQWTLSGDCFAGI